jgi:hypothetical protein
MGFIPNEVIRIFSLLKSFSHTITMGLTQPVTEMSTSNLPGGKGRPAHKANNLTAIYELIV